MTSATTGHGLVGVADAGAFLARLVRLDPGVPVRLRSAGEHTALWAYLPWNVLVTRTVTGAGPGDATVGAADLLAEVSRGGPALPPRRDADWRRPLPPPGEPVVLESLAAAELVRLAAAAAGTLRAAAAGGVGGRQVGERVLRDALLDHVALVVTEPQRIEVPQRLVQAVSRMGFLGAADGRVRVAVLGRWIGLVAPYGVAWLPPANSLTVRPIAHQPNG